MLFVSNGAQLLEKKIALARQRMFLFSDDVPIPTNLSSFQDMWEKTNKSRSFCYRIDADGKMQCTRGAGWSANKLFYNYVPNVRRDGSFDYNASSRNVTAFNHFCRYYAIGKDDDSYGAIGSVGSLLNTVTNGNPTPTVPPLLDMVLPPFDGSSYSLGMYSVSDSAFNPNLSEGGTIYGGGGSGIGRWTRETSSTLQTLGLTSLDYKTDTATISAYNAGVPYTGAGAEYTHTAYSFKEAPRIFQTFRTAVYGTTYFSGGGWSYSTSYSYGSYGSAYASTLFYYGKGTHADTPDYPIAWGAMSIAFAYGAPVYVVVSRADIDFVQTGLAGPNVKPVLSRNNQQEAIITRKHLM
ncbi:hypothetical protein HOT49_gp093 [Erwinia phage vB_EamM_Alexandra]|uniref:Uncharacterized protein n=1 Tax=Erwinia phage vB_EamM_Alexandra TaxID=2201424 RepID=A0A2Z4QEB1_9CAUD|nr:hypothetical protein HOT49_gp093 [Erwinia phage vB_EamM_Alexandra]AWY08369.1 hypothetical protein Alexandra_93 [Erwinia phage vB_EamM_Alexandra]